MTLLVRFTIAIALGQGAPAPPAQPPAPPAESAKVVPIPPGARPALPVLTLDQALREAQARNLDIKQAQARLDQANEASWQAWSYYLPQVKANGVYTRNEVEALIPAVPGLFPEPVVIQKRDQLSASLQVTQAVLAPAAFFAIKSAYRSERVSETNTEGARRDILFGVAQVYYNATALKQGAAVAERQLTINREHEKDARVRYEAGTTPKVALLRAEIDRSRAEQDLKRAENASLSAKVALSTLLDRPSADFDVAVPPAPGLPAEQDREAAALRDRPDVRAAAQSLELAEGVRSGIWAQYFPTLGAFGQLNWANLEGFTGKRTNWALGLSLTWTIFDGGLRESQLRLSSARVVEAETARSAAESRARDEVRRVQLDLDSAVANRAKAQEQVQLARENQRLIEVNYRAGAATYIEVTDATEALRSAELNQVAEALNADLAALRLLKAIGAFAAAKY